VVLRHFSFQPTCHRIALQGIVELHDKYDYSTRSMAVICLRNAVKKNWSTSRGGDLKPVPDEDRAAVRAALLRHTQEPNNRIAAQVCAATGAIARADWPVNWPDMFAGILQELDSSTDATAHRVLQMLHSIVKRVAERTLKTHKRAFFAMATELFPTISSLCSRFLNQLAEQAAALAQTAMASGASSPETTAAATDVVKTSIILRWACKVSCRLLRYGPSTLAASPEAGAYVQLCTQGSHALLDSLDGLQRVVAPQDGSEEDDVDEGLPSLALGVPEGVTDPVQGASALLQNIVQRLARTVTLALERHPVPMRSSIPLLARWALASLPRAIALRDGPYTVQHRHSIVGLSALHTLNHLLCCPQYTYPESISAPEVQAAASAAASSSGSAGAMTGAESDGYGAGLARVQTGGGTVHVEPDAAASAGALVVAYFMAPGGGAAGAEAGSPGDASRLELMIRFLLSRCLPPRPGQLAMWTEDAEEYLEREGAALSASDMSVAAEEVLQAAAYGPATAPAVIAATLHTVDAAEKRVRELSNGVAASSDGCTSLEGAFLQLDGAYRAAGTLSWALLEELNFPNWFSSSLQSILAVSQQVGLVSVALDGSCSSPTPAASTAGGGLQLPSSNVSITQCTLPLAHRAALKRILWMLACFKSKLTPAIRRELYTAIVATLRSPDSVLRVAARTTLQDFLEDYEYDPDEFRATLDAAVTGLLLEVTVSSGLERLLSGVHTLNTLLERQPMQYVRAIAPTIVPPMPGLWAALEASSPVRKSVLTTLELVVQAAGADSHELHPVVLPMLAEALALKPGHADTLAEDALPLWAAVMENAPGFTASLHQLWAFLVPAVNGDYKLAQSAADVFTGYLLVGGDDWACASGTMEQVAELFNGLVGTTSVRGTSALCKAMESALTLLSAGRLGATGVVSILQCSLARVLIGCLDSNEKAKARVAFLSVAARTLLIHPEGLCSLLANIEQEQVGAVRGGTADILSQPGSPARGASARTGGFNGTPFAESISEQCIVMKLALPGGACHLPLPVTADGSGLALLGALVDSWLEAWDVLSPPTTDPSRHKLWTMAMAHTLPILARGAAKAAGGNPPPAGWTSASGGRPWTELSMRLESVSSLVCGLHNNLHAAGAGGAGSYLPGMGGSPGLRGRALGTDEKLPPALRHAAEQSSAAVAATSALPHALRQQELWQRDVTVSASPLEVLLAALREVAGSLGTAALSSLLGGLDRETLGMLSAGLA